LRCVSGSAAKPAVAVSTISTNSSGSGIASVIAATNAPPVPRAISIATPFAVVSKALPVVTATDALFAVMPTSSRTRVFAAAATGTFASSRSTAVTTRSHPFNAMPKSAPELSAGARNRYFCATASSTKPTSV
jgi:hypothetical protein